MILRSRHYLTLHISEMVPDVCDRGTVTVEGSRDLHALYSAVSFRMTLSDLERLSKIFNDTKRRAVSLRQLSFLFKEEMVGG